MGQCCGKPADDGTLLPTVHEELLRSLSFIQGLKVVPSLAVLDSPAHPATCSDRLCVHTHNEGSLLFASMFVGIGTAGSEAIRIIKATMEDGWQQQLGQPADIALRSIMELIDSKLAASGKGAKLKPWAVGVTLVGDLRQKTLTVASVGCCHAALCRVVGSFSQATATGVPLTEAEHLRPIIAALAGAPHDSATQAAAGGHVLGLRPAAQATAGSRQATAGGTGRQTTGGGSREQAANEGPASFFLHTQVKVHALASPSPDIILCSDAMAAALSVPDLACLAHHFNPSHVQLLRDAASTQAFRAKNALAPTQRANVKRPPYQAPSSEKSASQSKATRLNATQAEVRNPCSPRRASLSSPPMSPRQQPLSPRSQPKSPRGNRQAAARTSSGAKSTPVTAAAPGKKGASTGPVTGNSPSPTKASPRRPSASSAQDPAYKVSPSAAISARGQAARQATPPKSPLHQQAGAAPGPEVTPVVGVEDVVPVQGAPFNLARLMLQQALARPDMLRLKRTRNRGAWRRKVLAAAAAAGVAAVSPAAAPAPAVAGGRKPAPGMAPAAGSAAAGRSQALDFTAAAPLVLQPVGPVGVLVLTLQWPLSMTSQQVALMRGVAAHRAANPRADAWWHMVRQLVRHMHHSRRRVSRAWDTTLTLVSGHLLQQKRAAEVLAWKHLGEAVMVSRGGNVRRSTPGAAPAAADASPVRSSTAARPSREDLSQGGAGAVETAGTAARPPIGTPPRPVTGGSCGARAKTGNGSPFDTPPRPSTIRNASAGGNVSTGSISSAAVCTANNNAAAIEGSGAMFGGLLRSDSSTCTPDLLAGRPVADSESISNAAYEDAAGDATGSSPQDVPVMAAKQIDACVVVFSPRHSTPPTRQGRATSDVITTPFESAKKDTHGSVKKETSPSGGRAKQGAAVTQAGSRRAAAAASVSLRPTRRTAG